MEDFKNEETEIQKYEEDLASFQDLDEKEKSKKIHIIYKKLHKLEIED